MWLVPFQVGMVPGDTPASEGKPGEQAGDSRERAGLEPAVSPQRRGDLEAAAPGQ